MSYSTLIAAGPMTKDAYGIYYRPMLFEERSDSEEISWVVAEEVFDGDAKQSSQARQIENRQVFSFVYKTLAWRTFCDAILVMADEEDLFEDDVSAIP